MPRDKSAATRIAFALGWPAAASNRYATAQHPFVAGWNEGRHKPLAWAMGVGSAAME
ncbi:MAG: hypothetical protein Q7K03_04900 [Dehalococcoidia bacterium]|nr:hypothetical protein [Dehalococcoidia bacterium]